jgi:hypothetical protein
MLCLCPEHASSEQIGVFDLYRLNKQIFLTLGLYLKFEIKETMFIVNNQQLLLDMK